MFNLVRTRWWIKQAALWVEYACRNLVELWRDEEELYQRAYAHAFWFGMERIRFSIVRAAVNFKWFLIDLNPVKWYRSIDARADEIVVDRWFKDEKISKRGAVARAVGMWLNEVVCEVRGHEWTAGGAGSPDSGYISLQCARCGCTKMTEGLY